jgi:hypothetical protein
MTVAVATSEQDLLRIRLSAALTAVPPGHEAVPGFTAWLNGQPYEVTAVLDRTAVIVREGQEKRLLRHDLLEVVEDAVNWRPNAPRYGRWVRLADVADVEDAPARAECQEHRSRADEGKEPNREVAGPIQLSARGAADAGRRYEPELAPLPPTQVPGEVDAQVEVASALRSCGRCGGKLRADNRRGTCTACQRTCPTCRGPKGVGAMQCRRCGHREVEDSAPTLQNVADRDLEMLPGRVQDFVEQFITVSRYAHDLEEEQDRQRQELHRLRRRVEAFLTADARVLAGPEGRI